MIYIVTLIVLIFLILRYDLRGRVKNGNIAYNLVELWFIAISALQYRMGADVVGYMNAFGQYEINLSWNYLSSFESKYPGWVLLNILCKLLCDDFVFLKTVIAVFVNHAFFSFFKKRCPYPFTCVLLYAIIIYLPLNFNILRQSISIAIFLLSYPYLRSGKLIKYYLCSIIALSFHSSSIILFILPCLDILVVGEKRIFISLIILLSLNFLVYFISDASTYIIALTHLLPDFILESNYSYFESAQYISHHNNIFGFIQDLLYSSVFVIIYAYYHKTSLKGQNVMEQKLMFFFVFFYVLNSIFPIIYRLNQFLCPIYLIVTAKVIMDYLISRKIRYVGLSMIFVVFVFGYIHLGYLFKKNQYYDEKPIVQYYPYYSIIDKKTDPVRERLWGDKNELMMKNR